MREQIIEKATEMFLNMGFKSITMDDISNEMGISKKTVYQYFKNKSDLITHCCNYVVGTILSDIEEIDQWKLNPIEELYETRKITLRRLNNEKASPAYQLEKYYPKIFETVRRERYDIIDGYILNNLRRGVEGGYYRPELDLEVVAKIYYTGMTSFKGGDITWAVDHTIPYLVNIFLEYHVRAIATPKGLETLEEILVRERSKSSRIAPVIRHPLKKDGA
ncbi:TetR/AcrR family transcriptional regulator [Sinomicrobium soli]|uniref:TetR/AcrR family transcriptional regulator n=1 Tax=Sinomicrobium sp. N-1-3-6 TaxID=2219864 RepID=UPI000DCD0D19|nr:TetR/AcrR family transcriptional regulator [Sinomicrobium sp. N-1-3-6]RAV29714.1 TetR/AcrR family transcriptional regulator [Sinomicrobium sp. N-1-3-6]